MDLTVIDAAGTTTEEVSLPDTVAARQIVGRLVKLLQLPETGPDGQPLVYKFHHVQSGRQVKDNETLAQAGVNEHDVLRLVAEITAGPGRLDTIALYDNPAGRLYDLLAQFRAIQHGTIANAWATILEVETDRVRERLGSVADLITQIDVIVSRPGMDVWTLPVNRYRDQWLEVAFPIRHSLSSDVSEVKPDDLAYETLATFATHLSAVASDGPLPSEEDRQKMFDDLQALIEEVTNNAELPPEIADLILRRLADIQTALRLLYIGGPEAIRHATEALMGAIIAASITNEKAGKAAVLKRALATAGIMWSIFTAGAQVQPSIEAWEGYSRLLNAGPAHVTPSPVQQSGEVLEAEIIDAKEVNGTNSHTPDDETKETGLSS
jgi:hypothetical protein